MDTKKFLFICGGVFVVFIVIVLVLVYGGKKNTPQETTLTFWNLGEDKTNFENLINTFQAANPTVKIEYTQKNEKDYLNEVLNSIAAGNGPDVLAIPNDWLPKYHNLLSPMPPNKIADAKLKKSDKEVYQETFAPVVSQDNIIADKIYGMPLSIDTLGLYYNSQLVAEAVSQYKKTAAGENDETISKIANEGPKNWDELVKLSQVATEKSASNISRAGIALGTANVNQAADILTLLMLQNGVEMTNSDNTAALFQTNQKNFENNIAFPGTEALDFYTGFADPQSTNYAWSDSLGNSVEAFANAKTAMLIDYQNQKSEIKRLSPDLDFTIYDVPQVKATKNPINYASYLTYGTSRNSKNADLAWDFIIQMTAQENAQEYASVTSQTSALLSRTDKTSPAYTAANWYKPDPQKSDEVFTNMISQVNAGTSAQTAIEGAAVQITTLLEQLKQ